MNLIDGVGGVFLFSNNPKQLTEWYRGKFAWVTDPDGNKIELFEEPPEPILVS